MKMEVKNINGRSDDSCKCGSWLEHWRKRTWHDNPFCSVDGCRNRRAVGVLIQKVFPADGFWFVVPVCEEHGRARGTLVLKEFVALVSADVSRTCGQRPRNADS